MNPLPFLRSLNIAFWQIACAVLLALLIVQTVRISGVWPFFDGLADKVADAENAKLEAVERAREADTRVAERRINDDAEQTKRKERLDEATVTGGRRARDCERLRARPNFDASAAGC